METVDIHANKSESNFPLSLDVCCGRSRESIPTICLICRLNKIRNMKNSESDCMLSDPLKPSPHAPTISFCWHSFMPLSPPRFPNPVAEAYHDSPCIEAKQDEKNHPWWWHNTKIQCLFARAQYLLVWVEQQIYFVMFSAAFPFWLEGNGKGGRGRWKDNTNVGRCLTFPIGSTTEKKKKRMKKAKRKNTFVMFMCSRFSFLFHSFRKDRKISFEGDEKKKRKQ